MQNPTRLEAKQRLSAVMTVGMDMNSAIQELIDRSYDTMAIPEALKELSFQVPTDLYQDPVTLKWFVKLLSDQYTCALKFRDGHNFFPVVSIGSLYQIPHNEQHHFVDYGETVIDTVNCRLYMVPDCLVKQDQIYPISALVQVRAPVIDDDSDVLPFRNISQIKCGLLAIGYENVNDSKLSQAYWQEFRFEHEASTRKYEGPKKVKLIFKDGLRRRPTNFM